MMRFEDHISRHPLVMDAARGADAVALCPSLPAPTQEVIRAAAGCSPYLAGLMGKETDWIGAMLSAPLPSPTAMIENETKGFEDLFPADLGKALRQVKRRVALMTALADLGGVWTLEQVTAALTALADRATDLALRVYLAEEIRRGKLPSTKDGDAQGGTGGLVALAMGKMGAAELNYSSDIDLIVLYDDSRYARDDQAEARASLIRVTRKAAALLSDITAEGYVFRTDLRLRPDASVTPVCLSMSAAEAYYEAEGRTWERAAYIKARPCAGDLAAGARFLDALRPFVWRKHLDFAAIQDAHDMRLRIRDHKGLNRRLEIAGHDMKLGEGGIREIEFFTQTRQLIAGGRDPDLRDMTTVGGLAALAAKGWIPQEVADELAQHYRTHREIEHRIQMLNDEQTHKLPVSPEGLETIAYLMGESDPRAFQESLTARLRRVEELTGAFFAPSDAPDRPPLSETAQAMIDGWRGYPALRSSRAQEIFRRVEPQILNRMARAAHPEEALNRFDGFLAGLPAGVQLFALFEANPSLIDLIVDICATSPALAGYLSRHAEVLDAVLGGAFFAPWPGAAALGQEAATLLHGALTASNGGYERALDAIRSWAHEWHFRIGVHHLRGLVDAAEAGAQYADLAEACVAALFPVVAQEFARRHGPPPGRGAVVLGMGSLGARRLNAGSDLDLIVLYDADGAEASEGDKPLATRPYYARLTQALVTALSAPTARGRLYEVDMRLRPSGRQGPVATSFDAFRDYQMNEAWTWEHLALTRARVMAHVGQDGDALSQMFNALRIEILAGCGGRARVMPDLAEMRRRIFAAKDTAGPWEAKTGPGRLQDIELLAQSFALRAGDRAQTTEAQIRTGMRAGLLAKEDAETLASAYRLFWRIQAGGRLISDRALDLENLGGGAQEFILREAGEHSLHTLAQRMQTMSEAAAAIIQGQLS